MALTQTVQSSVGLYAGQRYNGQLDTLQVSNLTDAILTTGPVAFGAPLARDGAGVKPFTGSSDVFVGFAARKHTVMNTYDSNTPTGYVVGDSVAIANFGYITPTEVEAAVLKGGSVFIRFGTGTGTTNVLGAIRGDADATGGVGEDEATAVEVSGVIFAEPASAGEMVRVVMTRIFE
jgi:hypothetical protein